MKTYYLLTLLFLFAGCSNQPQAPKDSTLPILDISKDYPLVKLDIHEIADVEYVPLETTDESVYTCISDWRISDKYIIGSDIGGSIYMFDRKGKFIRKINRIGQGPKEHYGVSEFSVDFNKEEYYIFDRTKLQVYSFSGEWLRTLKVPQGIRYGSLFDYNEQYMICDNTFHDYWNIENLPVDKTPYYLIDKQTGVLTVLPITVEERVSRTLVKRIEHIDAHTARKHFIYLGAIYPISANGHEFIIADFGLDTLYTYKDNVLTPLAIQYPSVHSGKVPLIVAPRYHTDKYLFFKPVKVEYIPGTDWDSSHKIYDDAPTLMWNRESNEIKQVRLYDSNRNKVIFTHMRYKQFEQGNQIFYSLLPERVCPEYEAGELKGKLAETVAKIKEDDNQILVICKMK